MKLLILSLLVICSVSLAEDCASQISFEEEFTAKNCGFCSGNCGYLTYCPYCSSSFRSCCASIGGNLRCDLSYCYCQRGNNPVAPPVKPPQSNNPGYLPTCSADCNALVNGKRVHCPNSNSCSISVVNGECYCSVGFCEPCYKDEPPSPPVNPPFTIPISPPVTRPVSPPVSPPVTPPQYVPETTDYYTDPTETSAYDTYTYDGSTYTSGSYETSNANLKAMSILLLIGAFCILG